MRLLLVEDETRLADSIARGLRQAAHAVDQADRLSVAREKLAIESYDAVILDVNLPDGSGFALAHDLRRSQVGTPILMLTARDGIEDRVKGLDSGADDYLVKPFAFSELLARVNALARRPHMKDEETKLRVADLEMDLIARKVTRAGEEIELQPREFRLLEVLMRNKGRVLTRTMLLERVWSFHFDPKTSVVETHISRLRSKIDKQFGRELIHTVRGSGYSLNDSI